MRRRRPVGRDARKMGDAAAKVCFAEDNEELDVGLHVLGREFFKMLKLRYESSEQSIPSKQFST